MNEFNKTLIKFIEKIINKKTQNQFLIQTIMPVIGGDINHAAIISDNNKSYFIKLNSHSKIELFNSEVVALNEISQTNTIQTPKVIGVDQFNDKSFLILQHLNLKSNGNIKQFAKKLAFLHKNTNVKFGFKQNNFIGTTKQINDQSSDWKEFYLKNRIGFQIKLLEKKYNVKKLKTNQQKLTDRIEKLFINYDPIPSLLHGDLWQGNYAFNNSDGAVIYDPACYYGDHETDLAMLELFGNPGKEFSASYDQYFPINEGYEKRKNLYNLYHILNHANMFGGGYFSQAENMMERLITLI